MGGKTFSANIKRTMPNVPILSKTVIQSDTIPPFEISLAAARPLKASSIIPAITVTPFVELNKKPHRADRFDMVSDFRDDDPGRSRRQLELRAQFVDSIVQFSLNHLDLCPHTRLSEMVPAQTLR